MLLTRNRALLNAFKLGIKYVLELLKRIFAKFTFELLFPVLCLVGICCREKHIARGDKRGGGGKCTLV
jgi:hypothetical protein